MRNVFVLVFRRAVAALFPSVPPRDQARVAAAMANPYPMTPATSFEGEARPVAGHGPVGRHGVMPACEEIVDWRPEPGNRYALSDRRLAATVAGWAKAIR